MWRNLLFLLLLASQMPTYAQWYEAQGYAYIANNDKDKARSRAMENALKKALLVAGASVSSVQQVVNGLLTQDEINIRASGSVNSFELVDETHQGDQITVTIRADIFPQDKQCFSADYRKSLLLTRSRIAIREHANVGEIYQLESEIMRKLADKISANGQYLDTKLAIKRPSNFSRLNASMNEEGISQLSMSLSDHTDSQFVLFSEIKDLSFGDSIENEWQFWQKDIFKRNFAVELYIYNGSSGEQIFNKQYHNSALWTYDKRKKVDIRSGAFWQSDYGFIVDETLNQMISDIDESMMCQPTRGKIVRVSGNQITFNLGARHGVKVNDEFSLLHSNIFKSAQGKQYAGFNVSPYKVKVISVSQNSAIAKTPDDHLLGNIQINDIAVRY